MEKNIRSEKMDKKEFDLKEFMERRNVSEQDMVEAE